MKEQAENRRLFRLGSLTLFCDMLEPLGKGQNQFHGFLRTGLVKSQNRFYGCLRTRLVKGLTGSIIF